MSKEELMSIMIMVILAIMYGIGYVFGYVKGKDAGIYQELTRKVKRHGQR